MRSNSLKKRINSTVFFALAIAFANGCLAQPVSTAVAEIACGNTIVRFETSCTAELPRIRFVHVHENEKTAVQAANDMLATYGKGCFTTWKALDDRYVSFMLGDSIFKFDPNRIYSEKGRRETLDSNGAYSPAADSIVNAVADLFLQQYIDSNYLIIALHNNTDGGGLHINSYRKHGAYAKDARKVHVNKHRDADDFFLTTSEVIFKKIKSKGYNVVLQDNDAVTDDGSLSVYAATKSIAYINIEAQHGHLEEQKEMIALLQTLLSDVKTKETYELL